MNISAFILAAGLGERLKPITDHIPKPLLPILGKPILQSVVEKACGMAADKIGLNLHYKKEPVEEWVRQSAFHNDIVLFPEDPVLGTGGALKNAESFLKGGTFLVHNADIFSDVDLTKLVEFHLSSGNLATLAVHDYADFNNLVTDDRGFLVELGTMCSLFRNPGTRLLAFTGIAVYAPEFLSLLPEGASSVVHSWTEAISAGHKVGTYDVTGSYWSDIGTPLSYARTVIDELRKNGETVCLHPSAGWCRQVELDGYIVIEETKGSRSFSNCQSADRLASTPALREMSFRNCIILPGAYLDNPVASPAPLKDIRFENCILGPGFRIDLNEAEMLGGDAKAGSVLIGAGGSDRRYFRVAGDNGSVVLMKSREDDPDLLRQLEYTRFFTKYSVPVPTMLGAGPEAASVYFEDLGDLSLYSWLKCPRSRKEIEGMFKRVLDILVILHTHAAAHVSECPLLEQRRFDYEHLRWETQYFLDRFVRGIAHIIPDLSALDAEFHMLAAKADAFPKTLVHRDFQSQNIMITKKGIPRVIDYQGARIGPPAYDVVSILWDPYHRLDDDLRRELLEYYIHRVIPLRTPSQKGGNDTDIPLFAEDGQGEILINDFQAGILPCRLQRHMQALGAYGYLSEAKEKKHFLKYVPEALRLLKEACALMKDEYPELHRLVFHMDS
jgi:NDP-sugar pyrophosphorylase family protein/aminoglycoside/choline kinase family phosphotransferase